MIISTNLNISQLTSTYVERITSRLFGNFKLFNIYGEDIRIKNNTREIKKSFNRLNNKNKNSSY